MPNSKQAKKRVKQDENRRLHNKAIRSSMRTAMKQVLAAETAADAEKALPIAVKRVDKAAKTNVIHRNTAARYKSRLAHAAAAKK